MTIDDGIEYLYKVNAKYTNKEDKDYYLIHALTDIAKKMSKDEFLNFKEKAYDQFN